MELNIFMKELESALITRGIPSETAKKHVSNLRRTFTNDDLSEIEAIQTKNEIDQLADSISVILNRNRKTEHSQSGGGSQPQTPPQPMQPVQQTPHSERELPVPRPAPQPQSNSIAPHQQSSPIPKHRPAKPNGQVKRHELPEDDDYFEYSGQQTETTRGVIIFWLGLFLTLPITIPLAALLFGSFAALFLGLGALIVGLIAVLIAVAASGAGVSLVGIIFGITQLFTFVSAGIYEIGLGVMVAGAVLFVSVLIYNIAIRFLPLLITLLGNFLGFVCGKLKILFLNIRRECYKL